MKVKEYIEIINTAHDDINMSFKDHGKGALRIIVKYKEYAFNLEGTKKELAANILAESKCNAFMDESTAFTYSSGSFAIWTDPSWLSYKEDNVVKALAYVKDFIIAHRKNLL